MAKFIIRRILSLLLTMLAASVVVFIIVDLMPGDLATKVLGQFATQEQKARWRELNGVNQPPLIRYSDWLLGSDWRVGKLTGHSLVQVPDRKTGEGQWWVRDAGNELVQWTMDDGELLRIQRAPAGQFDRIVTLKRGRETYLCTAQECLLAKTGGATDTLAGQEVDARCKADDSCQVCGPGNCMRNEAIRAGLPVICQGDTCWWERTTKSPAGDIWQHSEDGTLSFWGVDTANHVVLWQHGQSVDRRNRAVAGQAASVETGGVTYYPLQRGLLRGDPGRSFLTGRPVASTLFGRLLNSLWLAAIAFLIIMPLALLLGVVAALTEGKLSDRLISFISLVTTATPQFTTGALLILVFVIKMKPGLPGAVALMPGQSVFSQPKMLILPVLTLTLAELGYVARMTRASVTEILNAPFVRAATLKGLPRRRVIFRHALPSALMAPITVIMLHVNWLIGGIVVVEAMFGFPGLGQYLLEAALFGDVYAIEAGAMVMVLLAVGTQFLADLVYTFLNPRIRYA